MVDPKIRALKDNGVVVVAAAGNRARFQPHASVPAIFDNVISVGALMRLAINPGSLCANMLTFLLSVKIFPHHHRQSHFGGLPLPPLRNRWSGTASETLY